MLTAAFYWVANLSVAGSVAGLLILLLRLPRAVPRRIAYLLWLVPLVRFAIPLGLPWRFSLYNLLPSKTQPILGESVISNFFALAETYAPLRMKTAALERVFGVAAAVWLSVSLLLLVSVLLLYLAGLRQARDAAQIRGRVYRSAQCLSPAVFGVLRPKVVLPSYLKGSVAPIFLHERIHIKRRDNFWRMVAVAVCCLHWFNPLVWVFLRCFLSDLELSCDEAVLRRLGPSGRRDYAAALVTFEEQKAAFASQFAGAGTKSRIRRILSWRKLTLLASICLGGLVLAVAAVLLTNAIP